MPRTVEAWWSELGWREVCDIDGNPVTMDEAKRAHPEARYVGGVLERGARGGQWGGACLDQSLAVDEALRIDPHARFRLRPYDDAAGPAGIAALKDLTFGPEDAPHGYWSLQAEQQKQHAGRPVFFCNVPSCGATAAWEQADPNAPGKVARLCAAHAPQHPADASVAPPAFRPATESEMTAERRANALSDACGTLRTELDEAYAKIGRLTREVERLGRKKR